MEIAVPTSLDAGEKKAGGRAGRVPPSEVGETGLDSCDVKGGTRSGGGGRPRRLRPERT
jgi:hypothetical protein